MAAERFRDVNNPGLRDELVVLVHRIPATLLRHLDHFRRAEPAGGLLIRGILIDPALGPTPSHWAPPDPTRGSTIADFTVLILGSVLGDVFGWRCLQDGRLVHNVLPVAGHEREKSGLSSNSVLDLHTEDACHPARADYLLLLCLRNDDLVPTTYADLGQVHLPSDTAAVLAQSRFLLAPEPDHGIAFAQPQRTSVLIGPPSAQGLRFDGYYLSADADDPGACAALDELTHRIAEVKVDVVLREGDLLVLDNRHAVHGRPSFAARYDGNDRWLKRAHATRDLGRSRPWRRGSAVPIVENHSVDE